MAEARVEACPRDAFIAKALTLCSSSRKVRAGESMVIDHYPRWSEA